MWSLTTLRLWPMDPVPHRYQWKKCKMWYVLTFTTFTRFQYSLAHFLPSDMAPHVVSNSWGNFVGGEGQTWYDDIIRSWRAANIIPVFNIGNNGPNCKTSWYPGYHANVISVGSTEFNDRISTFSSRGPGADDMVKPELSAPGGEIRSAWHTGDNAYNTISGTSMACPHVSGLIALILERKPGLDYPRVLNAMSRTARTVRHGVDITGGNTCGGKSVNTTWPNNVFGRGRIDAVYSLNYVGTFY